MIGLMWYKPFGGKRVFCRQYVANAIAEIAGGDPKQYLVRAGKMIAKAKRRGDIKQAEGCKNYYEFVSIDANPSLRRP